MTVERRGDGLPGEASCNSETASSQSNPTVATTPSAVLNVASVAGNQLW